MAAAHSSENDLGVILPCDGVARLRGPRYLIGQPSRGTDTITIEVLPSVPVIELFGPPDSSTLYTLRGRLRITVTNPVKIRQISVKFKGFTQNERFRFASMPGTALAARNTNFGEETYLLIERSEKVIQATPRTLTPGTTDFPFELTFVADIPPSCTLSRGCIRYALSGHVVPDSVISFLRVNGIRASMPIIVRRNLLRSLALAPYAPTVRYRGRRAGRIEYEFEVPKMICLEQGRLEFSGKISPVYDSARVKRILVRMDQIEVFRTASKDQRRPSFGRFSDNPAIDITKPIQLEYDVDPNEPMTWEEPIAFDIPLNNSQLLSNLDTPIIDVTHKLRVRMSFVDPVAEKDMWLSFPIIISTIPGSDFQARLASGNIMTMESQFGLDFPPPPPLEDADLWLQSTEGDAELPSYQSIMEEPRPISPMATVSYPWRDPGASPPPSPPPFSTHRHSMALPTASSVSREDWNRRRNMGISLPTVLSSSIPMTFVASERGIGQQNILASGIAPPL